MLVIKKQSDLRATLESISSNSSVKSIGFVPTMGALHQGHLSLAAKSISENEITVVSIFVNPTQFNNATDLEKYPRTMDADVEKLKTLSDDIIVYAPSVDDIYEGDTVSQSFDFDGLEFQMEGKHRIGHFDGVGTIVKKLFEIIQPNNAYFGEKDFQQLQIVKKLVSKYNIPVNIVGCPILREANGLAMSSRNERLTADQREKSAFIFKILTEAKKIFGTNTAEETTNWIVNEFEKQNDLKLEYFQIADEETLLPCEVKENNKKYRAFIAVYVNEVRLIDTILLN
ncbi:MAG: pantoate--beta-alanine ligase [Flavobacterium sp.]